jgi:AcrR family transcriptional regulator
MAHDGDNGKLRQKPAMLGDVARPALTERRKAQTRRDIAETALTLFARDGYDDVSAEAIAEETGVSLRTFYRYFSTKDEVLSPIITEATAEIVGAIAARPARESLATAVQRAYAEIRPQQGPEGVRALIGFLTDVPALRARWLSDLRTIEDALVPVVQRRARRPMSDEQALITAAAIVTALRIAVETVVRSPANHPPAEALGRALKYLREGANL